MITVIIPVYNCENFIEDALRSVLCQTTEEALEILVIDDCSTDHTRQKVQQFISRYEEGELAEISLPVTAGTEQRREIRFLHNNENLGVAETRNTGIRNARGEYLAFLDGDDWWAEEKLEKQMTLLHKKQAILVYTGRELMRPNGTSSGKTIRVPQTVDYQSLLHTNAIPCSSVLMRTDVAREFYMCHDELHEDYILWLQVLKKYGTAYGIDEPLLKSRLSAGGKSRNKWKSAKMHYGVYRYLGIPVWRAVWLFLCYAVNGIKKYR